jgi:quercetin dioxygenase-like cupin family protein
MRRAVATLGLALLAFGFPARAENGRPPSEEMRAAQAIETALHRHGPDVHRCFEKALADRLDVSGKVEIEVDVGEGGKVTDARLSDPKQAAPELSGCLLAMATHWHVDGIEPGASVVLPFAFAGQMSQYVVKAADTPDRGPGAGKPGKGPARQPPFTVKVLADSVNVRAQNVSLTLLTIGPASRVAMTRHPHSGKALYMLRGKARLLGPTGSPPQKLEEGTAVFIPAGYPHVIENMGRQAPAIFLQAFAPPGPEKVYRNPADPEGRAEFEVIRDPGRAKAPPAANGKLVVKSRDDAEPLDIVGGKGLARIMLEPRTTGSDALALDLLEFSPGAEVPRHQHAGSTEVVYVLSGGGTLSVGSENHKFTAEEVLHLPPDQPHAAKFTGEKTIAVQIYAPAGPEQRFRGAPAPKEPAKP